MAEHFKDVDGGVFSVHDDGSDEAPVILAYADSDDEVAPDDEEEVGGFGLSAEQSVALGAELVRAGT